MLAGLLPKDGAEMYEIEFWNSIKDSTHAEDFEAYLKAYPNGRFAPLAKVRMERYRKSPPPVVEAAPEKAFDVQPLSGRYRVTTNTNVRAEPTVDAEKVSELNSGAQVDVTGRVENRNWYRIALPEGGPGYVYAPLLEKAESEQTSQPPPKPAPAVTRTEPVPKPTPARADAGSAFKDCQSCPEMVAIAPGTFTMGDSKGDISERPAHSVTIRKPFAIGKYEVTVAQWQACVEAGACQSATESVKTPDDAPIRDVSWGDAQDYVSWLSKVTRQTYRLPTEAEWEYAARAGTSTTYWWGNQMEPGHANCSDCGGSSGQDAPAAVGSLAANPFGIHDMNGNVWEWVDDCWHRNFEGAPGDGSSWDSGSCAQRVIRSGSWKNDKTYVHSASRFKYDTYVRYIQNGFRVAKTLE